REVAVAEANAAAPGKLPSTPPFHAETDYAWVALSDPGTGRTLAKLRTHSVEIFDGAAAIGDIVVMGGTQGLYAVKVDLDEAVRATTEQGAQAVAPLTTLAPRDFEPEWRSPSTELMATVFGEGNVILLRPDLVPAGVLDVPARRQLTEVGLPTVDNWFGLSVFSPSDQGLKEVDWHRHHGATPPQDSGPLYQLGEWLGGVLCLDGASGRVLRVAGSAAPDAAEPADPVVGTSFPSFVAMVTLYRAMLSAYESAAGDGEYLLAQLCRWLPEIDATAAASPVWQHAVEEQNFDAL
ncbi:SUKH-4 family immunity protein, partial [Streptomyces durbertensis]